MLNLDADWFQLASDTTHIKLNELEVLQIPLLANLPSNRLILFFETPDATDQENAGIVKHYWPIPDWATWASSMDGQSIFLDQRSILLTPFVWEAHSTYGSHLIVFTWKWVKQFRIRIWNSTNYDQ